jgi:PilZ domain
MTMLAAKKREARKLLGQSAWITLEGGFAARQCVVQDISPAGARIALDDAATLPATLRLAFSRDARTGHKCQVVWRRSRSAGLKFVR